MKRLAAALVLISAAIPAMAAQIKPAILYDLGGKFDKSCNESVHDGAEAFQNVPLRRHGRAWPGHP